MHFKFKHYIMDNTEVLVGCDYDPPQEEILYPNERAQPHYHAQMEVTEVFILDEDIYACLRDDCIDDLCSAAWDNIPGNDREE